MIYAHLNLSGTVSPVLLDLASRGMRRQLKALAFAQIQRLGMSMHPVYIPEPGTDEHKPGSTSPQVLLTTTSQGDILMPSPSAHIYSMNEPQLFGTGHSVWKLCAVWTKASLSIKCCVVVGTKILVSSA